MTEKKTGASFKKGKSKQDIGTPRCFIDAVERRFGRIVFDLAANASNAVCEDFYGPGSTRGENSLVSPWNLSGAARTGLLYLNPPFDPIAPWSAKCAQHWQRRGLIGLLVPSARGSNWFQQYVRPFAYVLDLGDRIQFNGEDHKYPKDLIFCLYGYGFVGEGYWHWDESVTKAYERKPKITAASAAE